MKGLGLVPTLPTVGQYSSIATTVQPVAPAPPKVSFLDKLTNTITKVTNVANTGVSTYNNINSAFNPPKQNTVQPGSPAGYTYEAPANSGATGSKTSTGMSTGAKVGIGLGVAALVAGLVVVATRGKKKGMGSLGDLNTAKTKSGKVKQRAAVFAKLDAEGKAYPKTKRGVRAKRKAKK